jgi:hypothetical protein
MLDADATQMIADATPVVADATRRVVASRGWRPRACSSAWP